MHNAVISAGDDWNDSAHADRDHRCAVVDRDAAPSTAAPDQIRAGTYADYVAGATDESAKDGITGAPTVLVDGKAVQQPTLEQVSAAVNAAS